MSAFVRVCRTAEIPPGHAARVDIDAIPVAIFNVGGEFFALDDTCSHAMASLSEGELDLGRCAVECPLHGSQFDLRSGAPLSLPAVDGVGVHAVEVRDDELWVALSPPPG